MIIYSNNKNTIFYFNFWFSAVVGGTLGSSSNWLAGKGRLSCLCLPGWDAAWIPPSFEVNSTFLFLLLLFRLSVDGTHYTGPSAFLTTPTWKLISCTHTFADTSRNNASPYLGISWPSRHTKNQGGQLVNESENKHKGPTLGPRTWSVVGRSLFTSSSLPYNLYWLVSSLCLPRSSSSWDWLQGFELNYILDTFLFWMLWQHLWTKLPRLGPSCDHPDLPSIVLWW